MSFPGATEPVVFDVYDGIVNKDKPPKSIAQLNIVDGGIFDNTGLATLLDVMFDQVIVTDTNNQELVVLFIDADNSENRNLAQVVKESTEEKSAYFSAVPKSIGLNLPVKGMGEGIKSAFLVHELNKRKAIRLMFYDAYKKIESLNANGRKISLKILPISIGSIVNDLDCKDLDCKQIKNIESYYAIHSHALTALEKASERLLKMQYSDVLRNFKKKYFLPQDSYMDNLFYQPDSSITMKEAILNAVATDRQELADRKGRQECKNMVEKFDVNGIYHIIDQKCLINGKN